jgi:hypothetical protein
MDIGEGPFFSRKTKNLGNVKQGMKGNSELGRK